MELKRYENGKTVPELIELGLRVTRIDVERFDKGDITFDEFIKCLDSDLYIIEKQIERIKYENIYNTTR